MRPTGLAEQCYMAAGKDPLLALLLALEYERLEAEPRWPLDHKFGGSGPRAREAALDPPTHLTAPAHALPHGAPPDPLEDELAA